MQDEISLYISCCVTDALKRCSSDERVTSRHVLDPCSPWSTDVNPRDIWLLKSLVILDNPETVPDLKHSISQHDCKISMSTLQYM